MSSYLYPIIGYYIFEGYVATQRGEPSLSGEISYRVPLNILQPIFLKSLVLLLY